LDFLRARRLFLSLDLVTFAVFPRKEGEIYVDPPAESQVWLIPKGMAQWEHATDSTHNRAAFRRAELILDWRVFSLVALRVSVKLNSESAHRPPLK
jgi:hypothetical protein